MKLVPYKKEDLKIRGEYRMGRKQAITQKSNYSTWTTSHQSNVIERRSIFNQNRYLKFF